MTSPIVARLLARHDLKHPDSRPLFAYELEPHELDAALTELRAATPGAPDTAAAFCVVAAELWRNQYDGGHWQWGLVLDVLGWSDLPATAVTSLVADGLRFWRRPLLRLARREFLGSIAREAGIPTPVLRGSGARLKAFLRLLIGDLATYGPERARALAEGLADRLPQRLRNPTILDLATELATTALALAQGLGTTPASPAALDRTHPSWRSAFPLRLDDDAALALVTGLLEDARQPRTPDPLRVQTDLVIDAAATLRRSLRLPPTLETAALADLVGLDPGALPARLDLLLEAPSGVIVLALLRSRHIGAPYRVERLTGPSLPLAPELDITLALRAAGSIVGRFVAPGGRGLGPASWVFRPDRGATDAYRLVAQGSTTFDSEVRVLAPAHHLPTPPLPALGQVAGRIHYAVDQATTFGDDDDAVNLRPGSPPPDDLFDWSGPRCALAPDAFLGVPTLWRSTPTGQRRSVARERIEARDARGWLPLESSHLGSVKVRVTEHDTSFSDRLVVLPADTLIALRPHGEDSATVDVRSSALVDVGVPPLPGLLAVSARTASSLTLEAPPELSRFELQLRFRHARACLELPFPRLGRRFTTTTGTALAPDDQVSLDGLFRVMAEAWPHPPTTRAVFALEASLRAEDATGEWQILGYLKPLADGRHALQLHALAPMLDRLLSVSATPSAHVVLRLLDAAGSPTRSPTLRVARYPVTVEISADKTCVTGPTDVIFEARRFVDADVPVVLPEVAPGRAPLAPLDSHPGAWMIFARRDGAVLSAPRLRIIPGAIGRSPLEQAIELNRFGDREPALLRVLEAMAASIDHPDWPLLEGLLDLIPEFTPATFEVVRLLPQVPVALVRALLAAPDPTVLVAALDSLPFVWEALPLDAVATALTTDAARFHRASPVPGGLPALADAARSRAKRVAAALASHHSAADILFAAATEQLPFARDFDKGELRLARQAPQIVVAQLGGPVNELRSRHADEAWPRLPALASLDRALSPPHPALASVVAPGTVDEPVMDIIRAPLLVAAAAASPTTRHLTPIQSFAVRMAEAFDPDYFAQAYSIALAIAVTHRDTQP